MWTHYPFFDADRHILNKKLPLKHFDTRLKEHLNITLLDQLIFYDNSHITFDHKIKVLKEREAYLQNLLRTLFLFENLNVLTKTTAARNGVAVSYHWVRGLHFLAVVFAATIVIWYNDTSISIKHKKYVVSSENSYWEKQEKKTDVTYYNRNRYDF